MDAGRKKGISMIRIIRIIDMDAGRKKGISMIRRKRRFIQFESHTRLLALIITLSVGYLGP